MQATKSMVRRAVFAVLLLPLVLSVSAPSPSEATAQPVLVWLNARIVPSRDRLHRWEHRARDRRTRVRHLSATLGRVGEAAHGSLLRAAARDMTRATARLNLAVRQVHRARQQLHFYLHARSMVLAGIAGSARGAPGLAGSVSYERWASALLASLGAPHCQSDLEAVVAWETAESSGARYNPLATTHPMPGSYAPTRSGVQVFASFSQGIAATRATLLRGPGYFNYASIVEDLISCAPAWTTGSAVRDSYWCRGCGGGAYVVDQLPAVVGDWAEHASRSVG